MAFNVLSLALTYIYDSHGKFKYSSVYTPKEIIRIEPVLSEEPLQRH